MLIKLFPKDYDPIVAAGLPDKNTGVHWTEEDVQKQKELEQQVEIVTVLNPPVFRWYEELSSGNSKDKT